MCITSQQSNNFQCKKERFSQHAALPKANRFANPRLQCIVNKHWPTPFAFLHRRWTQACSIYRQLYSTHCWSKDQVHPTRGRANIFIPSWWQCGLEFVQTYTCYYKELQTVASPNLLILFWIQSFFRWNSHTILKHSTKQIYSKLVQYSKLQKY